MISSIIALALKVISTGEVGALINYDGATHLSKEYTTACRKYVLSANAPDDDEDEEVVILHIHASVIIVWVEKYSSRREDPTVKVQLELGICTPGYSAVLSAFAERVAREEQETTNEPG